MNTIIRRIDALIEQQVANLNTLRSIRAALEPDPDLEAITHARLLERLESNLSGAVERIHAMLQSTDGASFATIKNDRRYSELQSVLNYRNKLGPRFYDRLNAILERNDLHITNNPAGKGQRVISTRF